MTNAQSWHQAAGVSVVASASAVWFLVGQLGEEGGTDYILRLPQPGRFVEVAIGVVSLLAAIVTGSVVSRRRGLFVQWSRVYGRLLLIGIIAALGLRIVTAASGGANIGGGMVLYLYPVPLLYFAEHALGEARALRGVGCSDPWGLWSLDWPVLGVLLAAAVLMATD